MTGGVQKARGYAPNDPDEVDRVFAEVLGDIDPGFVPARPKNFRPSAAAHSPIPYSWVGVEYSLPGIDQIAAVSRESFDADVAAQKRIAGQVGRQSIPLDGYLDSRDEWLAAHFRLNMDARLAPRFRPSIEPRQVPSTLAQATFACDRQVIDLHWLYCRGFSVTVGQPEFMGLLTDDAFEFGAAASFARANVTVERKVESWLAVPLGLQWQLCGLQNVAVRKRWAVIRWGEPRGTPGAAQIAARLAAVRQPASSATPSELVTRWMVEKMLPGAPSSERAQLFAVATGLPEAPPAHIFQRQQTAAMRRVAALCSRS